MHSEDHDMSLRHTAYLFFLHTTLALGCVLGVLVVGEYLVSGFATPFIDVVHMAMVVCACTIACVFLYSTDFHSPSMLSLFLQGLSIFIACIIGGILLWAHLDMSTVRDQILFAVYGILSIFGLVATLRNI